MPSRDLSELLFVSTMALKELEPTHSVTASSPTLESHPSSPDTCNCKSMFSLEMPEIVSKVGGSAFYCCSCLRNEAFPPNAVFGDYTFFQVYGSESFTDLQQLFGSEREIIRELQHRFDRLPIHKLVYYQSYHQGVLHNLIATINMRSGQDHAARSKLDPTGNQQDCLGMTPLHILACSAVHDLELCRVVVEKHPSNLITKDRWMHFGGLHQMR